MSASTYEFKNLKLVLSDRQAQRIKALWENLGEQAGVHPPLEGLLAHLIDVGLDVCEAPTDQDKPN